MNESSDEESLRAQALAAVQPLDALGLNRRRTRNLPRWGEPLPPGEGSHVTIVAMGRMVNLSNQVADKLAFANFPSAPVAARWMRMRAVLVCVSMSSDFAPSSMTIDTEPLGDGEDRERVAAERLRGEHMGLIELQRAALRNHIAGNSRS